MQIFSNWALAAWMSVVFLWELITQPYSLTQIFCSFHTVSHIYSWIIQGDYKHLPRLHVSIPVLKRVLVLKKESHWKLIVVLDVSQWEILLWRDSIFCVRVSALHPWSPPECSDLWDLVFFHIPTPATGGTFSCKAQFPLAMEYYSSDSN